DGRPSRRTARCRPRRTPGGCPCSRAPTAPALLEWAGDTAPHTKAPPGGQARCRGTGSTARDRYSQRGQPVCDVADTGGRGVGEHLAYLVRQRYTERCAPQEVPG